MFKIFVIFKEFRVGFSKLKFFHEILERVNGYERKRMA